MKEKRLTFEGDTLRINSLTFGEVIVTKKYVTKAFDPKGYFTLKGVKLLLTDNESQEVSKFLAMQ